MAVGDFATLCHFPPLNHVQLQSGATRNLCYKSEFGSGESGFKSLSNPRGCRCIKLLKARVDFRGCSLELAHTYQSSTRQLTELWQVHLTNGCLQRISDYFTAHVPGRLENWIVSCITIWDFFEIRWIFFFIIVWIAFLNV